MIDLYKFGRAVCKLVVRVWFKTEIIGIENVPTDRGIILVCNHRTYFDPIFAGISTKAKLNFMAKEELFKNKLFGGILKRLGAFPVSRGKGDMTAITKAVETIQRGEAMAIFPEGTRSKTDELLRFKSGAIVVASKTHGDIVPTAVYNTNGLKFRSKVIVKFGQVIKNDDLGIDVNSPVTIKKANSLIKDKVSELFEDIKKKAKIN